MYVTVAGRTVPLNHAFFLCIGFKSGPNCHICPFLSMVNLDSWHIPKIQRAERFLKFHVQRRAFQIKRECEDDSHSAFYWFLLFTF